MGQGFAAQPCELVEQQGIAYAKTVAEAMKLKLDMDNPADREKLRRAVLDLVAGRKCESKKDEARFDSSPFRARFTAKQSGGAAAGRGNAGALCCQSVCSA